MKELFKKISLGKIVDIIIYNFILFLIVFAWARYISKSSAIAIILCVIVLMGFNILYLFLSFKKQNKLKEKKEKTEEQENKTFSLLFLDENEIKDIIKKRYLAQNNSISTLNNLIILGNKEKDGIGYYFENRTLSLEKGLKIIHSATKEGARNIKILCYEINGKDRVKMENIEGIHVKIIDKEKLYNELIEPIDIDIYCKIKFSKNKKIRLKEFFKMAIKKEKAKKYFISGLIIFFCSLIVRFSLYYVFASSILFLLALLSYNEKMFQK